MALCLDPLFPICDSIFSNFPVGMDQIQYGKWACWIAISLHLWVVNVIAQPGKARMDVDNKARMDVDAF